MPRVRVITQQDNSVFASSKHAILKKNSIEKKYAKQCLPLPLFKSHDVDINCGLVGSICLLTYLLTYNYAKSIYASQQPAPRRLRWRTLGLWLWGVGWVGLGL